MKNSSIFKHYKKFNRENKVNIKIVKDVINMFNKEVNELLQEGFELKMPRLGYLSVVKFQQKIVLNDDGTINKNKLKVNWNETRKLRCKKFPNMTYKEINKHLRDIGEASKYRVFHFNEHTEGYICRYKWDKSCALLKNKAVYKFLPTKHNRLSLAKKIREDGVSKYQISTLKIK